jgi:hypothetical protein
VPALGSTTVAGLTTTPQTAALANVPAAGPYDPNAYQASASLAASQPGGTTTPAVDRYGSYPMAAQPASVSPVSVPKLTPTTSTAAVDRYALPATATSAPYTPSQSPSGDRYATALPASPVSVNSQPSSAASDPYGPLPNIASVAAPTTSFASQAAPAGAAANTAPAALSSAPAPGFAAGPVAAEQAPAAATATVQIKSPAGQYRPGGTSSFTSTAGGNRIDVASRPGAPATSPTSAPTSTTPPSDPWAPQPAPPTSAPPARHGGSVSAGAGGSVF